MCKIGSTKLIDNLNPLSSKGALSPWRGVRDLKDYKDSMTPDLPDLPETEALTDPPKPEKLPVVAPPAPPATPQGKDVTRAKQEAKRAAGKRKGLGSTLLADAASNAGALGSSPSGRSTLLGGG